MVQPAAVGTKRACLSCGTRFYDLDRDLIVCPKCGHEHTADSFIKMRRARSGGAEVVKLQAKRKAEPAPIGEETELPEEGFDVELEEEAGEDEAVIEDTSDLGEDEDLSEDLGRGDGLDGGDR